MRSEAYLEWIQDEMACVDLQDQLDALVSDVDECAKINRETTWDF